MINNQYIVEYNGFQVGHNTERFLMLYLPDISLLDKVERFSRTFFILFEETDTTSWNPYNIHKIYIDSILNLYAKYKNEYYLTIKNYIKYFNIKIYYGIKNHKIDITDICFKQLHSHIIIIPSCDIVRAQKYGDPCHGKKKIYLYFR